MARVSAGLMMVGQRIAERRRKRRRAGKLVGRLRQAAGRR